MFFIRTRSSGKSLFRSRINHWFLFEYRRFVAKEVFHIFKCGCNVNCIQKQTNRIFSIIYDWSVFAYVTTERAALPGIGCNDPV